MNCGRPEGIPKGLFYQRNALQCYLSLSSGLTAVSVAEVRLFAAVCATSPPMSRGNQKGRAPVRFFGCHSHQYVAAPLLSASNNGKLRDSSPAAEK